MIAKNFTLGEAAPHIEPVRIRERAPGFQFEVREPCSFGECLDMGDKLIGSTLPSGFRNDVEFLQFRELATQEQGAAPDDAILCSSHEHMYPIG